MTYILSALGLSSTRQGARQGGLARSADCTQAYIMHLPNMPHIMRRGLHASTILGKRIPSLSSIKPVDIQEYARQAKELEPVRLATEPVDGSGEQTGLVKSFLWGSSSAKAEANQMEQSFSQQLQRGKYVHGIEFHDVHPTKSVEYCELLNEAYPMLNSDPAIREHSRLVGSWRTVIGDMDRFVHIWEYDGYVGYHNAMVAAHKKPEYLDYLEQLRASLRSRNSNIIQEFGFWGGTSRPHNLGGIFELRAYTLKPGKLLEWETHWRKGIEVRRQVMEPVGAWFSQIGPLNKVYHLWQFADFEQRKLARQKSWELDGWADTTHKTVELIEHMDSSVLVPMEFSPLR